MIIKTNCKDSIVKLIGENSEINKPKIIIVAIPKRKILNPKVKINEDMGYEFSFDIKNAKRKPLIYLKDFTEQHILITIIPSRLRQPKIFIHDYKGQDINLFAKFYYKNLK